MPSPSRKQPRNRLGVIPMPHGNRLVSEEYILRELAPLGVSLRGFRSLLRALQVPTIEIGRTRFFDLLSFSLALRFVLRIGQPSFFAPGCEAIDKNRVDRENGTTTLDLDAFRENIPVLLSELLVAAKTSKTKHPSLPSTAKAAKAAAARMALTAIHSSPLTEQQMYDTENLERAAEEGLSHE